jgi:hypothetical protein
MHCARTNDARPMKTSHTRPTDAEVIELISSNLQMLNRLLLGRKRERPSKARGSGPPGQQSLLSSDPPLSQAPAERFMRAWLSGALPLPVHICSAKQLHAGYSRWCEESAVRGPPLPQSAFTLWVRKWASEIDGSAEERQLGIQYRVITIRPEKSSVRCWMPLRCALPAGVSLGAWAGSCLKEFDAALQGTRPAKDLRSYRNA